MFWNLESSLSWSALMRLASSRRRLVWSCSSRSMVCFCFFSRFSTSWSYWRFLACAEQSRQIQPWIWPEGIECFLCESMYIRCLKTFSNVLFWKLTCWHVNLATTLCALFIINTEWSFRFRFRRKTEKNKNRTENWKEHTTPLRYKKVTHSRFLFKAPVDLLPLLLQLVAQLLLCPLLLFLQEAQLSQLLPPDETTPTSVNRRPLSQIYSFVDDSIAFYLFIFLFSESRLFYWYMFTLCVNDMWQ